MDMGLTAFLPVDVLLKPLRGQSGARRGGVQGFSMRLDAL